jgi:HEAT repeat protein
MIAKFRKIFENLPFLVGISAVSAIATALCIDPASRYIINRSVSVEHNFYILGGIMVLVMCASSVQALLAVRLIWGANAVWGFRPSKTTDDDVDSDLLEMRALKATNTKKAMVLIVLVAVNMVLFDRLGSGVLFSDTRTYRVTTLLRSPNGQDRADATHEAILLIGDPRVTHALKRVIDNPGQAREWAAYAAGIRNDITVADSLALLLRSGNPREKAASSMALARLGDERLIPIAPEAYAHANDLKGDLVKALGMLGQMTLPRIGDENRTTAGTFLAGILQEKNLSKEVPDITIWALGQFEAPQGLEAIEAIVQTTKDLGTLCTGVEALGKIGSQDTSPKLIKMIPQVNKNTRCPETVYKDFAGDEVLLSSGVNVVERLLYEIGRIGDLRAQPEMETLQKNTAFPKTIRRLAGEIAYRMKRK